MADFPRTVAPNNFGDLEMGASVLVSRAQGGQENVRTIPKAGARWWESWAPLQKKNLEAVAEQIALLKYNFNQGIALDAKHLGTHGSGLDPNGAGDAGVTVDGADQTGSSITVSGLTSIKAGDVFTIDGVDRVLQCRADSTGPTIEFFPPIFAGGAPADNASVTLSDVTFSVRIAELDVGSEPPDKLLRGVRVTLVEQIG